MALTIMIHIQGEAEVILGEVEALPGPDALSLLVNNPRQRDGKDLKYLSQGVVTALWPMARVSFIEVMPSTEEEEIVSFVRE